MADIKSIASFIPEYRVSVNDIFEKYHDMSKFNYRKAVKVLKEMTRKFRRLSLNNLRWLYEQRLQLSEKIVPGPNEDALTAGVQSLAYAIERAGIKPEDIDALFVVSESFPYAVGSSTKIAGKLGLTGLKYGVRGEFACKPYGEFIDIGASLIDSGRAKYVAIVATDASQAKPGDDLEFSASYYSTSTILGPDGTGIAKIQGRTSVNYDFPDFIRKEGIHVPEHEGQGTSLAFRGMILSAIKRHIEHYNIPAESLINKTWVIHSPNGSFPNEALKDISEELGITLAKKIYDEQGKLLTIKPEVKISNLASEIANGYSATVPTALCNALEQGNPDEEIITVLYGSGAGSDIISIRLTDKPTKGIENNHVPTVREQINRKQKISIEEYFSLRDNPEREARHIALLRLDAIGKEYYKVEGCPKCGAIYFGDSWTSDNFPDFNPPKKFLMMKNKCIRGVQKNPGDTKRICGGTLKTIKLPKRARIVECEFYSPKVKNRRKKLAENPYWVMFERHMVRGFNYNPKSSHFEPGVEVEAIIGRWRPHPKDSVPFIYVPMYHVVRKNEKQ